MLGGAGKETGIAASILLLVARAWDKILIAAAAKYGMPSGRSAHSTRDESGRGRNFAAGG
jgi:hypothetical protein